MFDLRKTGPTRPFVHAYDCEILAADPVVEIQWSEIERGHWVAECVCGTEHYREPRTRPVRLDPHDPRTAGHAPQCEFVGETNPATLKVLLKVSERDNHWWVCEWSWQVPYEAESVGARR